MIEIDGKKENRDTPKPCPFCGSIDVAYNNTTRPCFLEWYECGSCGARANSLEEWNRRAPVNTPCTCGKRAATVHLCMECFEDAVSVDDDEPKENANG